MGRKPKQQRLKAYMNDVAVGMLTRQSSGILEFRYLDEWLNRRPNLAISRSLPLRKEAFTGEEVANYFDNLLPDNQEIRHLLARKAHSESTDAFDILSRIGRDCVGALQLLPEEEEPTRDSKSGSHSITDSAIAQILSNLGKNPLGIDLDENFRISIAGAQEKTAFLRKNGRWYIPVGTTPSTHIFKPSLGILQDTIDLSQSVENEWLCLQICRLYGLPTAEAEIHDFESTRALVVTRFDRYQEHGRLYRVPQEDFCQALGYPSHKKYESEGGPGIRAIMEVLNESNHREEDRKNFMKSQIIFWVMAAIDGHAKNFSLHPQPTAFTMTPLYDVISAHPVVEKGQLHERKLKMAMAVGDNRHYKIYEIHRRHWLQTAKKVRMSDDEISSIIEEVVKNTPRVIEEASDLLPKRFPRNVSDPIFSKMKSQAQLLQR